MKKSVSLLLFILLFLINVKIFAQCSDMGATWYAPLTFPPVTPLNNSKTETIYYPYQSAILASGLLNVDIASVTTITMPPNFSNNNSSFNKNASAIATIEFNIPISKSLGIESFKISNVGSAENQIISAKDINGSFVELIWLSSSIKDVSTTNDPAFINNEVVGNNPPFSGTVEFSFKSAIKTLIISRKSGVTTNGDVNITFQKICISNTPTPVELTFFKAQAANNIVKLNWQTASEKNNKGFEVERSIDANTWENIGGVKGQGESNMIINYSFEDKYPLSILTYYRLKQVDFDGKESYSNIESVAAYKTNLSFEVYPNPINNKEATMTIDEDLLEGTLTVINSIGLVVKKEKILIKNLSLDFSNLTTGIYIFNVQKGSNFLSKKIIIAE
jgi:Secretion system C-terminal sorting domain